MGGFVLHGAEHAQGSVESSFVVPVDPAGGRVLDVGDGPVGAGPAWISGADALGLVQPNHRRHQGVVEGVTDRPDRGADPLEVEMLGEPDRENRGPTQDLVVLLQPADLGLQLLDLGQLLAGRPRPLTAVGLGLTDPLRRPPDYADWGPGIVVARGLTGVLGLPGSA